MFSQTLPHLSAFFAANILMKLTLCSYRYFHVDEYFITTYLIGLIIFNHNVYKTCNSIEGLQTYACKVQKINNHVEMGENSTEIPHHTYQIKSTHFYPVTDVTIHGSKCHVRFNLVLFWVLQIHTNGIVGLYKNNSDLILHTSEPHGI